MTTRSRTTFRALTLNVHEWRSAHGEANHENVADLLLRVDPDVIALQEVTLDDAWEEFRRLTCRKRWHSTEARADYGLWNVLLTRSKPTETESIQLEVDPHAERRSAAIATVRSPWGLISVASVHLGYQDEETRLRQLQRLCGSLATRGEEFIVMGDLNALRRADYTLARWRSIQVARERTGLEPAENDVARMVDDLGWVDLARLYDARSSLAEYARRLSCPIGDELSRTSAHGTRVDYLLATRGLAAEMQDVLCGLSGDGNSDHEAVAVSASSVRPRRCRR